MRGASQKSLLLIRLIMLLRLPAPPHYAAAAAAKVPAIIVFGDSTVDAGNNNQIPTMLRSDFRPYGRDFAGGKPTGRFSNGRIATDFYSEAFGLRPIVPAYLDPDYGIKDFALGVCFASAGSGLDIATSDVLSVIPLWKQVEFFKEYQTRLVSYLGADGAKETISEAVYAISIGTNDFIENYYSFMTDRFLEFTVDEYEDYLVGLAREFLIEIYNLGARKIGFTGMAAMGCLPMERSRNFMLACVEDYNKVARDFNTKVQVMCEELGTTLPGIQLKVAQFYDFFLHIVHNPSLYGFENVAIGCCATGLFELGFMCNQWSPFTCTDATKYAFWDAVHPTEKMSRIIAEYLLNTTFLHFA